MLTAKIVENWNMVETVFEITQARKWLHEDRKAGDDIIGSVELTLAEGGSITYTISAASPADGSRDTNIYVMNRNGATVATYVL